MKRARHPSPAEKKRLSSLDWLLERSGTPPMTEAERDLLLAEIDGVLPAPAGSQPTNPAPSNQGLSASPRRAKTRRTRH